MLLVGCRYGPLTTIVEFRLLYHLTSRSSALSIIRQRAIFGISSGSESDAEGYAHFHHARLKEGRNQIDSSEFRLNFECVLPERRCGGVPANGQSFEPGILHLLFYDWNPYQPDVAHNFWQAIIHPSTIAPLRFVGYEYSGEKRLTYSEKRMLRTSSEARVAVDVVWNPYSSLARMAAQRSLQEPSSWSKIFSWLK